ncbi:MAG: GNAT family N-acetyltransferase [Pirellulaceae bacterium]
MNLKGRIQLALRQEKGLRLTAAEVQALASALKIGFPAKRQYREKPSPSKEPLQGKIQFMNRQDLDAVVAIDEAATSRAWSKDDYLASLSQQMVVAKVIERPAVGRRRRAIIGAIVYRRWKDSSRIDLERIVVDPDFQLHSFGRQLIASLQSNLNSRHYTYVRAIVDEHNLPLLLFLRAVGFAAVDTEDGNVIMEYYWHGEPRPFHVPGLDAPIDSAKSTWRSEVYGDDEENEGLKT